MRCRRDESCLRAVGIIPTALPNDRPYCPVRFTFRRPEAGLQPARPGPTSRSTASAGTVARRRNAAGRGKGSLDRISPAGRGRPGGRENRGRPSRRRRASGTTGRPRPASSRVEAGRPGRSRERPRRTRGSVPERRVTPSSRWFKAALVALLPRNAVSLARAPARARAPFLRPQATAARARSPDERPALTGRKEVASRFPATFQPHSSPGFPSLSNGLIVNEAARADRPGISRKLIRPTPSPNGGNRLPRPPFSRWPPRVGGATGRGPRGSRSARVPRGSSPHPSRRS